MTTKLYQQVADDLRDLIQHGIYLPGDKLPSIRHLATQKNISIATVQRAIEEIEALGLVEVKPKSGVYVRVPVKQDMGIETTLLPLIPKSIEIHEFASQLFHQCDSENVINLGTSYPDTRPFSEKYIQKFTHKILKTHLHDIVEVHFSPGHEKLRQVLCKRLNEYGCRLTPNELIVTNGCLEALSLCLRSVAKPGDTIAIESPGFMGLFQLIESLGLKALEVPCDPVKGMSLDALELALEQWEVKAAAIVPTYSNPLGSNMPLENRKKLVEMLNDRDIPLIEDDLLGDLSFDGSRIKPCKAFDKKGLVLYCSSASKTIASGLRLGWIAPGGFYKEVSYFKTFTNISPPNITQLIVAEFLASGKYDRYLRQFTADLAKRLYQFQRAVERHFPVGTKLSHPRGGCILWVELPKGLNGLTLFKQAIKEGIAIIPGQLSSGSNKFDHCIRINYACSQAIDIEQTIKKLGQMVSKLASDL